MVRIGIAGIGFMGWIHWLAYREVEGTRVAAICARDARKKAGDWRSIKGNFGPPGEQVDLSDVRVHDAFEPLIEDPNIDLIDVCLPPHLHASAAIRALEAGKHVFCEKPMALTADDCDRMCAASERTGRQLLIGQVLPFFPEYAFALQAARGGSYGTILGGSFKRVISNPEWIPDFFDPDRVGGPLIDLHVHDAHFIRVLFGMPSAVVSEGRMRARVVEHCSTLFRFDDRAYSVSATCGVIGQQGRPFTHGFEIHFERATLQYEFAVVEGAGQLLMPLTVFLADGRVERPDLGGGDPLGAFHAEIREVKTAVETGVASDLVSGTLARDAIILCQRQAESVMRRAGVDVA
ncbi:MAG: Gfo/Idh/MocA family oxidoreductase [Planctomycetes bacterium]|nr:Gfo/Idh/MocA family oxidoreductase [Planctomycetota bacterium]